MERGGSFWSLGGPSFLYRTPQTTIWIDPYFYGTPDDSVPDAYRSTSIPIKPDTEKIEALLKRSRADYVFLSRYHPRRYSDKVNGLIFLDDYARLGEVIWSSAREGASEEIMCVLVRIKPTRHKQIKAAVSLRTTNYI